MLVVKNELKHDETQEMSVEKFKSNSFCLPDGKKVFYVNIFLTYKYLNVLRDSLESMEFEEKEFTKYGRKKLPRKCILYSENKCQDLLAQGEYKSRTFTPSIFSLKSKIELFLMREKPFVDCFIIKLENGSNSMGEHTFQSFDGGYVSFLWLGVGRTIYLKNGKSTHKLYPKQGSLIILDNETATDWKLKIPKTKIKDLQSPCHMIIFK